MNLFEHAANLLDEGIIADTCNPTKSGIAVNFYKQLEKPAKQIPGEVGLDQFRTQSKELTNLAMRVLNVKNDPFIKCIMTAINGVIDRGETEHVENAEFISWSKFMTFIKDSIDTINVNVSKFKTDETALNDYAYRLVDRFFTNVVAKDIQKHQSTKAFKHRKRMQDNASVKAAIDRFSVGLKDATNGEYDIVIQSGSKNAAPIIIDYKDCLQLTVSNYNEFAGFVNAEDMTDFVKMVKNTFTNILGKIIGKQAIPEGVTFTYKGDALVACDWGKLKNSNGDFGGRHDVGIYKLSDGNYVHFLYDGMSRHSKSDAGMSYENGESRYDNEFSQDKETVTVSLNMNNSLHSGYSKDVNHYIFEIVEGDNGDTGYNYVSRGTYMIANSTPDAVVYKRTSNDIPRITGTTTVEESLFIAQRAEMIEETMNVIKKAGYRIIK